MTVRDRVALIRSMIESLQDLPNQQSERSQAIKQMKGLLKTNRPTAEQVEAMLKERRMEKLQLS